MLLAQAALFRLLENWSGARTASIGPGTTVCLKTLTNENGIIARISELIPMDIFHASKVRRMTEISDESINMLIDRVVKDQIEVHIEMTPENISIDIQPWKPYEMKCPYAERKEE